MQCELFACLHRFRCVTSLSACGDQGGFAAPQRPAPGLLHRHVGAAKSEHSRSVAGAVAVSFVNHSAPRRHCSVDALRGELELVPRERPALGADLHAGLQSEGLFAGKRRHLHSLVSDAASQPFFTVDRHTCALSL